MNYIGTNAYIMNVWGVRNVSAHHKLENGPDVYECMWKPLFRVDALLYEELAIRKL